MRRYNADLANDFGNLVNRTVSMAGATSTASGRRRGRRRLAARHGLVGTFERVGRAIEACLLHEALAEIWDFVGAANR